MYAGSIDETLKRGYSPDLGAKDTQPAEKEGLQVSGDLKSDKPSLRSASSCEFEALEWRWSKIPPIYGVANRPRFGCYSQVPTYMVTCF